MRDFDLSTPLIRVEPPLDTTSLSPLSVQFPFSVQLLFFSSNQPPVLGVDVWTNLARGNEWAASPLTDVTAETLQRSKIVGLPAGVIVRSFEGRITPYKTGFHEFTIRVTFDNGRGSDCWWSSSFGKNGKIFVTDVTESSPPASRVRGIGDILLGIDHSWFIPETKWVGSPGYKSPRPSSPLTPILTSPSPTASSSTVSPVSSPSSTSSSSSPSTIHSGQPIAPFRLSRTPSPSPGFPSASLGQSALSLGDLHNENVVLSGVLRFPVESAYWARLIPVGLVNHFGLIRKNAWWLEPNLYRGSDKPTQFFLFERSDHLFVVLIPLTVNGVASAILPQRDSTIGVQVTLEEGHDGRARIYVMVATGKSPAQIVSFAMERVRCYMMINAGMDWSSAMRLAKVKSPLSLGVDAAKNPQWYDRLGVCTWNMFYKQPTHEGCLSAIASLIHDYQIPVGYLLLDDGYAQTTQLERLTSFEPDPRKFPRGLSTFVEDVRRRFGVKHFGVWHALQGYWNGVENDSILGRQYALRNIKSRPNVWVVEGSDVERFYENLYTYLKQQGIDFFKIDNQASFDLYLNEPLYNKQPLWRLYQDAILRVAYPSCIWCMGQSPNITYYTFSYAIPTLHGTNTTPGTSTPPNPPTPPPQQVQPFPVSRSSDDYYPEKIDLQAGHVLTNGMNNIWTSAWGNFLADWDMFQSDIAFGGKLNHLCAHLLFVTVRSTPSKPTKRLLAPSTMVRYTFRMNPEVLTQPL
ncbi:glycoside hydrolase family 36 protein [Gonapodya prolifera JEL478]|uniref:Glycoside hydrolase family 36 protein n=1 Tax=Gonapodya prolifera (strain JEL478) TaxID=1344416 RepID=A0A139AFF4_GONPJ|nr:glycoside hydrolase family 36 protein [Gonapodya prolifera JEL478]|eukprot:KXS15143.1 glycoside hydrolase family 36 protein [Gonapodya prolifera JEL478]